MFVPHLEHIQSSRNNKIIFIDVVNEASMISHTLSVCFAFAISFHSWRE